MSDTTTTKDLDTKFKRGQSGNTKGRPKGSKNVITTETKEMIKNFVNGKLADINTLYDECSTKERVGLLTNLIKYVVPQLSSQDLKAEVSDIKIMVEYIKSEGAD